MVVHLLRVLGILFLASLAACGNGGNAGPAVAGLPAMSGRWVGRIGNTSMIRAFLSEAPFTNAITGSGELISPTCRETVTVSGFRSSQNPGVVELTLKGTGAIIFQVELQGTFGTGTYAGTFTMSSGQSASACLPSDSGSVFFGRALPGGVQGTFQGDWDAAGTIGATWVLGQTGGTVLGVCSFTGNMCSGGTFFEGTALATTLLGEMRSLGLAQANYEIVVKWDPATGKITGNWGISGGSPALPCMPGRRNVMDLDFLMPVVAAPEDEPEATLGVQVYSLDPETGESDEVQVMRRVRVDPNR